jgi:putative CocE/NonD family hydrolase
MVGGSYEGLTQWWTAQTRPPHLRCIAPLCVGAAQPARWSFNTGIPYQYMAWWLFLVQGRTYQQGGPSWETGFEHLPLRTLDEQLGTTGSGWADYVNGSFDYLDGNGALTEDAFAALDIPVLIGVGWWDDQTTMDAWRALQTAKSAADCRLLVGPWDHGGNLAPRAILGGLDVSAGTMDTVDHIERFLAQHLKGEGSGVGESGRCRLFRTGEERWEDRDVWPDPAQKNASWWLTDKETLSPVEPIVNGCDKWVYDPAQPLRDMVDLDVFAWSDPPLDRRYLQRNDGTLVYTTEILDTPLRVSGQLLFEGWISSDRPDTDVFFELTDVYPDGRAITLGSEIGGHGIRVRHRTPGSDLPLMPDEVVRIEINGPYIHHTFLPGHRMQVSIRSTAWPFFARNLGGGGSWADETVAHITQNHIHRGPAFPSRLLVPVEDHSTRAQS